ncbi:MAG: tRNA threonylcarbamoyladenosine biosynthesis protein [Microgenomates group bacterium Gr01-1014_80]|nr:MAG: tRNA threonylcarbamoyladenosine biosynthesis protein [Microgenomates group bacterium Gr01-1014_80]
MWKKAAEILRGGGVVIIPSDSSYGIAALASNPQSVERLYQIKSREAGKPSLLIVGSMGQARGLVEFTPLAEELAKKYWLASLRGRSGPGGLTLVLNAKKLDLPEQIYGSGDTSDVSSQVMPGLHIGSERNVTLAVRLPDKKELQDLALEVGPFILPSANLAGEKPPFLAEEVDEKLKSQVDYFLDEPTDGSPPSTLVDVTGEKPYILRKGPVKVAEKS